MKIQFFQLVASDFNIAEIYTLRNLTDETIRPFVDKIKRYVLKIANITGLDDKLVKAYQDYFDYYVGNAMLKEGDNEQIKKALEIIDDMVNTKMEIKTPRGIIEKLKVNAYALFDILYILVPENNGPFEDALQTSIQGGRKPKTKSKPKKRK